jgi:quercetin dioxygenase-like cupin family protein
MQKTIMNNTELTNYVEVTDEPNHKEIYKNQHIRLYIATIHPGQQTLYHRHTEDTVYIIIQGGVIGNQVAGNPKHYPIDFPKSFDFLTKIRWYIRNLFIDSIKMSKGFFFCMMHQKQPVIHRASASNSNKEDIIMMGIEIKKESNHNNQLFFTNNLYKIDYESNSFTVYRLKLISGELTGYHTYDFPALIIVLKGTGCINAEESITSTIKNITMACGNFQWYDCKTTLNISNIGDNCFEAIIITLNCPIQ